MKTFRELTIVILAFSTGCGVFFPRAGQSFPTAGATNTPHLVVATETLTVDLDTPTPLLIPSSTAKLRPTMIPTLIASPTAYNPCAVSTPSDLSSMSVAFVAKWDGDLEIYVVYADGSELTQLTSNTIDDVAPTWSPDGNKIAYVSERGPKPGQLFVMNSNGSDTRPLTPDLFAIDPLAWSPDGHHIAFEGINVGANDFYVINLDNASLVNLTQNRAYVGLNSLTWSPNGDALAFDAGLDPSGSMRIVVIAKSDGTGLQELLQPDAFSNDSFPQWHPADQMILFISAPGLSSGPEQLYLMNPDGSGRQQLTSVDTLKTLALWSPNGQMIAYGAVTYTIDSQANYNILNTMINVLSRDGTNQGTMVEGKELQSAMFSWAPDNRHLAVISTESGITNRYDLYVADICDKSAYIIAKNVSNRAPSWKP